LVLPTGCQHRGSPDALIAEIQKQRAEKDASYKNSPSSPIPDELKKDFPGLSYFPINLRYRHQLPLHKFEKPESFKITTSSGVERAALKYGYFEFDLDGQRCRLQVYKLLDIQSKYPGYLFIPFRDATSGKDGYPGGRYLDFVENDSGMYVLDFNLAYNPSCAYGKAGYNCPIPPEENRLSLAIRAGEKYLAATH